MLASESLRGVQGKANQLGKAVSLAERVDKKLGEYDPETEEILKLVFCKNQPDESTYKVTYAGKGIDFGKATGTSITTKGSLRQIDSHPDRRLLSTQTYVTSQGDQGWPSKMFVIDRQKGLLRQSDDMKMSEPSEIERDEILHLLRTSNQAPSELKTPETFTERTGGLTTGEYTLIGSLSVGVCATLVTSIPLFANYHERGVWDFEEALSLNPGKVITSLGCAVLLLAWMKFLYPNSTDQT